MLEKLIFSQKWRLELDEARTSGNNSTSDTWGQQDRLNPIPVFCPPAPAHRPHPQQPHVKPTDSLPSWVSFSSGPAHWDDHWDPVCSGSGCPHSSWPLTWPGTKTTSSLHFIPLDSSPSSSCPLICVKGSAVSCSVSTSHYKADPSADPGRIRVGGGRRIAQALWNREEGGSTMVLPWQQLPPLFIWKPHQDTEHTHTHTMHMCVCAPWATISLSFSKYRIAQIW